MEKYCSKCGDKNWSIWTSASTGSVKHYCKTCRKSRAQAYSQRRDIALGTHTKKQWLVILSNHTHCPNCERKWEEIPKRPNKRYKYVWTKDHIVPLNKGGNNSIDNLQPLCYQCNFGKR